LSIYNQTQSPCIKSAVDRLSDTNLANKINVLIHNVFWDSPNVNLTIIEDPNLTVDGNPHEAATTRAQQSGTTLSIEIRLNPTYFDFANTTSEYITAVVYHEAVHAYLLSQGMASITFVQHQYFLYNYLGSVSAALNEVFPSMSYDDSIGLAIYGIRELYKLNPQKFENELDKYSIKNYSAFQYVGEQYRNKEKGTACN
jgi:hypothetical protein